MRRIMGAILGISLAAFTGCFPSTPLHQSINEPGSRIDLRRHLSTGNTTVVCFYADWCPACRKWKPTLDAINAQFPDMVVQFVNIGEFDSPVARQYGITFVPSFRIIDERGRLVAKDKAADRWLRREIARRLAARR